MKMKNLVLSALVGLVSALSATSASAVINVTMGGTAVANEGLYSSVVGAITTNFNSSLVNPANYFGGGVVNGNNPGLWASPPSDTSNYFSVGPSTTSIAVTDSGLASYFGYYGGSPDTYNSVTFFNTITDSVVGWFDGAQLAAFAGVPPNGNQAAGFFWNFTASDAGSYFNAVRFDSGSNAFETDNHAVLAAAVPEPETYAMMLIGLGMVGFTARRRKNNQV
jgi:PEP-CTERM motif